MSERKRPEGTSSQQIEWLPKDSSVTLTSEPDKLGNHWIALLAGVVLPAAVIAIELATRMCAEAFFDPIPTYTHVVLVALVPIANLVLLNHSVRRDPVLPKWAAPLSGVSIAVSAFYALLFLPLLPLAVVAILFYGIGLLPMGPIASFLVTLKLRSRLAAQHGASWSARPVWYGAAAGLAALLALDVPAAATRLGVQWAVSENSEDRARGLSLLRTLGDQQQLLRLCYDSAGRPSGLLSFLVIYGGAPLFDVREQSLARSAAEVREIFYRAYGIPFNALPPPHKNGQWARFNDFAFDADHGGTAVGGRIKGLDLVSSRVDGSVSGDDATAYLEWVFEFRNTSPVDREARVGLALPPGAVVSRATLWVNGEEREAAYGGRGEVRQAYQQVAVQQRRDPLLVTTKGAGRVLAQAFPVGANGGTIKFKIGMTAPLELLSKDRAALTMPAIFERNFGVQGDVKHAVWIEGKQALTASGGDFKSEAIDAERFRLEGTLSDDALPQNRPKIVVARDPAVNRLLARASGTGAIVQEIVSATDAKPSALMIVLDGSLRVGSHARAIVDALDAIPAGTRVGLIMADDGLVRVPVAPWSAAHAQSIKSAIQSARFVGGQDNAAALSEAVKSLEKEAGAALLWVHGPQPVEFRATAAVLEQASNRVSNFPQLYLYAVEPGPNEVLPDAPWAWGATLLPVHDGAKADLASFFETHLAGDGALKIVRRMEASASGPATGSEHIARLWARDEALALMRQHGEASRTEAVRIATGHRLVTPVTGAVVLETQKQFADNGLTPVAKASVPTVPEPHEWAMIILASFALLFMAWRQRQTFGDFA